MSQRSPAYQQTLSVLASRLQPSQYLTQGLHYSLALDTCNFSDTKSVEQTAGRTRHDKVERLWVGPLLVGFMDSPSSEERQLGSLDALAHPAA